jgi:chemotaxis protein CheX
MDVAYINPFITAVSNVFSTMVRVPIQLGTITLRKPGDRLYKLYRVSAVIELSGAVGGRVVISFAQPVAVCLAGAMMGKILPTEEGPDMLDALGEIANMVVGGAKPSMPDADQIEISTPTVVHSDTVAACGNPAILIPFDTPAGRFVIESSVSKRLARRAA